ncbi:MAG: DegT/DnrJ/EryC1/StrS family aminotransferase [Acetobacter peroxydans]|jgi:perosamine synthetase|nr:DegT/DnrJ/EryC1/StrS family aminotransferase [Acetobacter peroxydans]MCI2078072.1 DegT/DnrJ/EryC1/StrS family aminotransferase [Acetobacter peroxydans]
MKRIYYTKPSITALEIEYATDAATHGWGENCYKYIERFEDAFAQRLRVSQCIATSSATGALHIGFAALGIKPGDEVILADINWIASAAPIVHLGATPVFVDILPDTWCLDPAAVERAITPRTKAILAVHLYGNLCEMDALLAIGERYGIPVVEDAAEAIGSSYHGRAAGSMGVFSSFSFHGTKTLTTGEGGLFATSDPALFDKALTLSNHGRQRGQSKQFWADMVGFKYKMSNVQAAIGCAQLERWDELVARKRQIFHWYQEELEGLPLLMNPEKAGTINGFWMPTIVVNPDVSFDRDVILSRFKSEAIDGRVFFWPLSMLPMFKEQPENRVSYDIYRRALNLPSYHDMTQDDVQRVATIVRQVLT